MSAVQTATNASIEAAIDLALRTLAAAGVAGEVGAARSEEWTVNVRLGAIETVQSAVTRGLRVTALGEGGRSASTTSSDLEPAAVTRIAAKAVELLAYADPDPWTALPPASECGVASAGLGGDDPDWSRFDRDAFTARVVEAERIALAHDPRIGNSHRSTGRASRGEHWYASSDGVRVQRAGTRFAYNVSVVARDAAGERQTGGYGTRARFAAGLKSEAEVGGEAGRRAVQGFGWRKIPSGPIPVLLHREVASELLGTLADAVSGGAIYRGSSFLAGRMGELIASPAVTVIDDPFVAGALGTRPCDGEGVRARRVALVEAGRLASWLVDGYAARRLQHPYTGHDGGVSNLRLEPGTASFADLLRELGTGLLIHDLQGSGVDLASGTYSKGVEGFWVEDGVVVHPVQEVTVAANLKELLSGIRVVGSDPLDESTVSSPSLIVDGFTVGGT